MRPLDQSYWLRSRRFTILKPLDKCSSSLGNLLSFIAEPLGIYGIDAAAVSTAAAGLNAKGRAPLEFASHRSTGVNIMSASD